MSESLIDTDATRTIYRGRKIDLALKTIRLADGSETTREVVLHPGAVALVPFIDRDHVCLVNNYRYAIDRELLEVPAGTIDAGESPNETAERELREETGYTARTVRPVADWFVSPGVMNERMYLYVCEDLTLGETEHQPDERLKPVILPWDDAVRRVLAGEIVDAKTIVAILLIDRLRSREIGSAGEQTQRRVDERRVFEND